MARYNPLDPSHLIRLNQRRIVWQGLLGFPLLACLLAALAWLTVQPRDGLGMGKLIQDSEQRHWLAFGHTLWVGNALGETQFQLDTRVDSGLGGPLTDLCATQQGGVVIASQQGLITWLDAVGEVRQQIQWPQAGKILLACRASEPEVWLLHADTGLLYQITPQGQAQLRWRGPPGIANLSWASDHTLWLPLPGSAQLLKLRLTDNQLSSLALPDCQNFQQPLSVLSDSTQGFWIVRQTPGGIFGMVEHHAGMTPEVISGELPWLSSPVFLSHGFDERLLVVDSRRDRVLQLTADGNFLDEFGDRHLRHQLSQFRWRGLDQPLVCGLFWLMLGLAGFCLFQFGRLVVYGLQASQMPRLKQARDKLLKAPNGRPARLVHWAAGSALLPVPCLLWLSSTTAGATSAWQFAILALMSVALACVFLQFRRQLPDYLPFAGRARWRAIPAALNQAVSQEPALAKRIRQHGAIYLVVPSREGLLLLAERAIIVLGQRLETLAPRAVEIFPYGGFESARHQKVRLARRLKGLPGHRVILHQGGEEPLAFHLSSEMECRLFIQWFYRLHPTLRHHNPENNALSQRYRYLGCAAAFGLGALSAAFLVQHQAGIGHLAVAIGSASWLAVTAWLAGKQAGLRPARRSYDYAIR